MTLAMKTYQDELVNLKQENAVLADRLSKSAELAKSYRSQMDAEKEARHTFELRAAALEAENKAIKEMTKK